jgi:phosphopantothenoylcysteine decarboxylase/phosphopantothenate--cysteine ligase
MIENLSILLGVTGGVAAYKAVELASRLTAGGAKVTTVMTENACRLVGPKSFEAVTGSAVYTSLWNPSDTQFTICDLRPDKPPVKPGAKYLAPRFTRGSVHISLVDWAELVVVAPATANIIGKIANGICDDLLSTTLCACWAKPKLLAPAMNNNMWENPAVQRNVEILKEMGYELIGPVKGRLACGTEAIGRMAEPQDILQAIEKIASEFNRGERKERRE